MVVMHFITLLVTPEDLGVDRASPRCQNPVRQHCQPCCRCLEALPAPLIPTAVPPEVFTPTSPRIEGRLLDQAQPQMPCTPILGGGGATCAAYPSYELGRVTPRKIIISEMELSRNEFFEFDPSGPPQLGAAFGGRGQGGGGPNMYTCSR